MDRSNTTSDFPIQFLCNLIPKEFTGNRFELGQFLANCNNANELASERQKTPLLYFILSKISGNAKEQLALQDFHNWAELKDQLKRLYQDKKHYCQIMEELNNCKQFPSEGINAFYQRLLTLSSRALSAIQQYASDPLEILGKKKSVEEATLNRFVYHSSPQISQMLRWKDFDNLNSAYSAAVSEERALNMHKYTKQGSCKICKRTNHETSQCRFKSSGPNHNRVVNHVQTPNQSRNNYHNSHQQNPTESHQSYTQNRYQNQNHVSSNQPVNQSKSCNYCKKQGHLIAECRKRQFNNSRREQFTNQNSSRTENAAVHLNSQESPATDTVLTDRISQLTVFEN